MVSRGAASGARAGEAPRPSVFVSYSHSEERFALAMRRGQEVAVADTVRHVKEAIVEGRVRDGDPDLLSHAILGVTGQLARTFIHERNASVDEVADAAVAFCIEGMLGR